MLSKQDYLTELISFGKNISLNDKIGNVLYCIAFTAIHFAEYNSAIDILQRIGKDNIQLYIRAQLTLVESYMYMSNFDKAKECFENVSVICKRGICDDETYIEYIIHYSLYLEKSSPNSLEKESAIQMMEEILELDTNDVTKAKIYNCLGGFYADLNRDCDDINKSLYYHMEALKIREKNRSKIWDLAKTYNNLGMVYYYKSKYSDKEENLKSAEKYYEKTLELRLEIFGDNHPNIARALVNLGDIFVEQGKYEKALQYMIKGLNIRKNTLGKLTLEVCLTYNNMVKPYMKLNDEDNAYNCAKQAQEICLLLYGEDSEFYQNMCYTHFLIFNDYL